jgi:hypothetical protein
MHRAVLSKRSLLMGSNNVDLLAQYACRELPKKLVVGCLSFTPGVDAALQLRGGKTDVLAKIDRFPDILLLDGIGDLPYEFLLPLVLELSVGEVKLAMDDGGLSERNGELAEHWVKVVAIKNGDDSSYRVVWCHDRDISIALFPTDVYIDESGEILAAAKSK